MVTDKISKCTSCGDPVIWVDLKSGKRHPLNAEIVESDGVHKLYVDDIKGFEVLPKGRKGWLTHFATCPHAAQWRRK